MGDPPTRYIWWQRSDSGHPSDRSPRSSSCVDDQALRAWTGSWPVGRVALWCSGRGSTGKWTGFIVGEVARVFRGTQA